MTSVAGRARGGCIGLGLKRSFYLGARRKKLVRDTFFLAVFPR